MSDMTDSRGGNFFRINDRRVHEDDLTPRQRKALGLPELPPPDAPTDAPAPSTDATPSA